MSCQNIQFRTALAFQGPPRLKPDQNKLGRPNGYSYFQEAKMMWILGQLKQEKKILRFLVCKERVTHKQFAQVTRNSEKSLERI